MIQPLVCLCLLATNASTSIEPVRFELENGLRCTLVPAPGGTQVALVTLFDIGEAWDPPGQSGLAHYLEHVYVTAAAGETPMRSAEDYQGGYQGQANAQTGWDYTVVSQVFPAGQLQQEIADAAARMGGLRITQADLDREIPRLRLELNNMYLGLPNLAGRNRARHAARSLPAGARPGGVMEHLEKIELETLQEFHRRYYKPQNARVIVAGSFDPEDAQEWIEASFEELSAGEALPDRTELLPAPLGEQSFTFPPPDFGEWPQSMASVAFPAPAPDSEHYPAFLLWVSKFYELAFPKMQASRGQEQPFYYAVLDDPTVAYLNVQSSEDLSDEELIDRLQEQLDQCAAANMEGLVKGMFFQAQLAPALGLAEIPEQIVAANPYFGAFTLGRAQQMGLHGIDLQASLDAMTAEKLRACFDDCFQLERGALAIARRQ